MPYCDLHNMNHPPSLMTPTTEPLSSFDSDFYNCHDEHESVSTSSSSSSLSQPQSSSSNYNPEDNNNHNHNTNNHIFFGEKNSCNVINNKEHKQYALQITLSGVKY